MHSGRIEYRGDAGLRGTEEFSVTVAEDGTRTLTAHCRMFDTRVERWVVHTVDADFVPQRSFVSQRKAGLFLGEGWFTFEPGLLRGHSVVAGQGECRQEVAISGSLDYFVPHAVAADSWITPCHDRGSADWQEIRNGFTSSLLPDGSTGPRIEQHVGIVQRYLGRERLTVPAGEYLVDHFVVSARPGIEEHLWVSADELSMLVKLRSDRLATTYLLSEHRVEPTWRLKTT